MIYGSADVYNMHDFDVSKQFVSPDWCRMNNAKLSNYKKKKKKTFVGSSFSALSRAL